MQKVDEAIRQFNLMADAADEIERQYAARVASREATPQQRALAKATRLTWSEAKPGRAAYKTARRAGMSRAEASKASAEALAPLKQAATTQRLSRCHDDCTESSAATRTTRSPAGSWKPTAEERSPRVNQVERIHRNRLSTQPGSGASRPAEGAA